MHRGADLRVFETLQKVVEFKGRGEKNGIVWDTVFRSVNHRVGGDDAQLVLEWLDVGYPENGGTRRYAARKLDRNISTGRVSSTAPEG